MAATDPRTATQAQWEDLATRVKAKADNSAIKNSTITIQKNSVAVDTFTLNQASDKTINITVPTTAADVSALPASTKYGATFEASINSTTYVMTMTLKDQDGNTLGTAQTVDLPLESMVVSGSYDDTTKKIILTLQSGSTVEFSVADLVSDLQTEITSSNKLSADLVDDTSTTHKFATAAQLTKLDNLPTITTIGSNLTLTSGTLSATDTTYSAFTGADGTNAGTSGLVPAPAATDNTKYLRGDGTWQTVSSYSLPAATTSTIGGVIVGSGLSVANDGTISADTQAATFTTNEWNALWA